MSREGATGEPLRVTRFASATAFLEATEPFLATREAEHTVILGAAMAARRQEADGVDPGRSFLAVVSGDGAPRLAAMLTPDRGALLSMGARSSISPLADELAATDPDLPGVEGEVSLAAAFVARWRQARGGDAGVLVSERLYRLTALRPPVRQAPGHARLATEADLPIAAGWFEAFVAEALPHEVPGDGRAMAAARIGHPDRILMLWEVDGAPVSMAGAGAFTIRGARVAPVYTPPAHRGHGYGSAVTAAVTRHLLDAGRSETYLFTDLANPTSNAIYAALGYEPVSDVDRYRLGWGNLAIRPSVPKLNRHTIQNP
jgi:predicted GNAT family acetyltransferase